MTGPDRRAFLGASEIGAVLGLSPHRTPFDVWQEKVAPTPAPQIETEDTIRGHAMEPVIEAVLRHRGIVLAPGGEWAIPGTPIVAHPDRIGAGTLWEFKAPRRWSAQWGEDGTDDIPTAYLCQVAVQLAAMRANNTAIERAVVVVMCGELRTYPIPFVPETAERIVAYCMAWWERHVVKGDPPPAHSVEEINKIVARVPSVQVGEEMARRIARLKTLRKIETRAKDLGDEEKRAVLADLSFHGAALPESIAGPDGEIIATTRRGSREVVDVKAIKEVDPALVERCSRTTEWNELRPAKRLPLIEMPEILAITEEA